MIDEDAAIKINGIIMPEFNQLKSLIFFVNYSSHFSLISYLQLNK